MGFEPTRAEHIGLAVQRLNHSATSSLISKEPQRKNFKMKYTMFCRNLSITSALFHFCGMQTLWLMNNDTFPWSPLFRLSNKRISPAWSINIPSIQGALKRDISKSSNGPCFEGAWKGKLKVIVAFISFHWETVRTPVCISRQISIKKTQFEKQANYNLHTKSIEAAEGIERAF